MSAGSEIKQDLLFVLRYQEVVNTLAVQSATQNHIAEYSG